MKKLIVALVMASMFSLTLGCGDKPTSKGTTKAPETKAPDKPAETK